jgi:DeoR/GlpR family transcriptional regulator of sugar metabolism
MLAKQRHAEITKLVEEKGFVQVAELSRLFNVSEVTIRTDLRTLEQAGKIERNFGGAASKEIESSPFQSLTLMLSENKTAIAKKAVSLIKEGESIFVDASSTAWHLALQIKESLRNVTVISNSIPVFELFKTYEEGTLIGIPGTLNPLSQSFVGPFAEEIVGRLRATKAFITPKAIHPEGLRDDHMMNAAIRKKMMEASTESIILADHSKFSNSRCLFEIIGFASISTVITDRLPDPEFLEIFDQKGIRLYIADETEQA